MSIIEKTLHAMMTVGKESIYLASVVYTHIGVYTQSHCEKNLSMKKSTTVLCYTVYLCVCSILLLKGSTPDINNSSSHTLGALYHVVVVALPLLIQLELLTHTMGLFGFIASD